jgi:hypothetical protein
MNKDDSLLQELSYLMLLSKEGKINEEQFRRLESLLQTNEIARRYYVKLINNDLYLHDSDIINYLGNQQLYGLDDLYELAEYERAAPEVQTSKGKPGSELIQKVVYPPKEKRKISRFSIFMLFNAAAILLFFLFLNFTASQKGIEVATLTDSVNAKWAEDTFLIKTGVRMATGNERVLLREGYAELLFDNQARITFEGPAEFQILADDRISLNYGKVYLAVPREAIGFSVYTSNTKIIDMGTEFGVQSDFNGTTQLHVIKGKTVLMAGAADKIHLEVSEGTAKKVSGAAGEISDVRCQSDYFVRAINSESNCVWRGQDKISLADIVGGGNGLGTGTIDMIIDPISGKPTKELWGRRQSTNDYHRVPSNPYIDGVFIPNGNTQQIISSEGHLFQDCPVTSGLCCDSFSYELRSLDLQTTLNSTASVSPVAHSLLIHANMGITFDLQAIRNLLPDVNIVRFQSKVGIRGAVRPSASNADFWILVDGKLRHMKTQVKVNSIFDVDIELSENDRFLTLVETDGGDPENRIVEGLVVPSIDSDWGIFADPVLVLE